MAGGGTFTSPEISPTPPPLDMLTLPPLCVDMEMRRLLSKHDLPLVSEWSGTEQELDTKVNLEYHITTF
jgi:hypothetical protein